MSARAVPGPRLAVDVIIEHPGGLVLVRRRGEPPGWALPGGFVEEGESPEAAAAREAREETGLAVSGLRQFRVFGEPGRDPRGHTVSVVFSARARGIPRASDDAAEARVFPRRALPAGLAFDHDRIIRAYLRRSPSRRAPARRQFPRVGIVGLGRIGLAVARGTLAAGCLRPRDLVLCEKDPDRRGAGSELGSRLTDSVREAAEFADLLVLAVKPQERRVPVAEIALSERFRARRGVLVSVLAGVPCAWFEAELGRVPVVRAMPNLGITVGAGMTVLCAGSAAGRRHLEQAGRLFRALGETAEAGEDLMDAVTALSGSGPAYFFRLMAVMESFGARRGLDPAVAARLTAVTALAAARLAAGNDPSSLVGEVASRGGTTAAALEVFDERDFDGLVAAALAAALRRGRELSG